MMQTKEFHISDILTVTTGRLVSSRHMEGVYEILNFLTGDSLMTHQLPRAARDCEPWLKQQFSHLMADSPAMAVALDGLDKCLALDSDDRQARDRTIKAFVQGVRLKCAQFPEVLPEMLQVKAIPRSMQNHVDPIAEAEALVGKDRVIVINQSDQAATAPEWPNEIGVSNE